MRTIYVLIGPPGSGKSTWTKAHLATTTATTAVASTDDLLEEYATLHGISYAEAWTIHFKDAEKKMLIDFRSALARGDDVIIDRTNMRAKVRRTFLSQVPRKTYRVVAVVFDVPRAELDARLEARAARTGKYIPPYAVSNMINTYQPPQDGEFDEVINIPHMSEAA